MCWTDLTTTTIAAAAETSGWAATTGTTHHPTPYHFSTQNAGADYAFDSTFLDYGDKTQGLWNFGEAYIRERDILPTFWNSVHDAGQKFTVGQ